MYYSTKDDRNKYEMCMERNREEELRSRRITIVNNPWRTLERHDYKASLYALVMDYFDTRLSRFLYWLPFIVRLR